MLLSFNLLYMYALTPARVEWDQEERHFTVRAWSRQHVRHVCSQLAYAYPYFSIDVDVHILECLTY